MYTNVRLDTIEHDKALQVFIKYATEHTGTKFLLAKETGSQTGKPHLQGWCLHSEKRTAFRQYVYTSFPELIGGSRSVVKTNNITNEYAYICKNKVKPGFQYSDCITNYTQEEYDEITKDISQFLPKNEFFAKKNKSQSWWHDTIDILDQQCVYKGQILYSTIPTVFFKLPMPKRLSKAIIKENLQGMIMELERRHYGNTRLHDEYMESVVCDPLFKHDKEEFNLFKKINS